MISRLLSAGLATAMVLGLAAEGWAQAGKPSGPRTRKPDQAPTAQEKAAAKNDEPAATPAEPSSGPAEGSGTKDAFDQAAAKMKGTDAKAGVSPGDEPKLEKATFGAGCFWHVEADFEWLPGVKSAVSGYSGGHVANPSYELVHEGETGHAEVVQVTYDPSVISYEQLLKVFWHAHDPTQWLRQGPDIGPQYRSVIFYHTEAQRKAALKSYRELTSARAYRAPIVTQLFPMKAFYRAEEYHQNYYGGKPDQPVARSPRSRRTAARATARKKAVTAAGTPATKKEGAASKPVDTAGKPDSEP